MHTRQKLKVKDLVAGDVVRLLDHVGEPYIEAFQSTFVERIDKDGAHMFRPYVSAPRTNFLDNEKRSNPEVGFERWLLPFGNPCEYELIRPSPFRVPVDRDEEMTRSLHHLLGSYGFNTVYGSARAVSEQEPNIHLRTALQEMGERGLIRISLKGHTLYVNADVGSFVLELGGVHEERILLVDHGPQAEVVRHLIYRSTQ